MSKILLVLLLCVGSSSCAYYQYSGVYKNALKSQANTTVTKAEDYQELKERITGYLKGQGYTNVVFADQKNRFFVFNKVGDFGIPCQIIVKYTQSEGEDKIRVDIVKGSEELLTDSEVSEDIQIIADEINSK